MALMLASGKTNPTRNAALLWAALFWALAALQIVLGSGRAYGADPIVCMPWVAKIVGVQGQVDTRRAGETHWRPARLEEMFCGGDMVRVSGRSRAAILLRENETTLRLDQRTTITIPKAAPAAPLWLELLRGAANFLSRTPISLKIMTPFLNAHIEGTEFLVRVEEDRTSILVFSGAVLAENSAGSVTLQSGEKAVATASQAPKRSLVIRPRDAVVWALYYPPIIDYRAAIYASRGNVRHLRDALLLYRQGKLVEALARLDSVPSSEWDNPYFDLRAGLLLSVGRIDEALPAIDQALSRNPKDGTALALRSVMTLVRNDKDEALSLAQAAAAIEPRSAVPHIALSYVLQARFELDEALATLSKAVALAPEDALVHARLAELELSRGNLDRALTSAERATELSPQLSRTQTVLGFAYLTQIKTKRAKVAFREAIRLDSADPLARLGLGLAMIREAKVKDGTRELETAASLDPNTTLMRSYLGKAYYEQKRGTLAATEYKTAKTLDPQDPTPWFYDAILKQATNRPVEALEDLQGAIERNDNRLVYRSRLLLDSDLAARSANLGRTYNDLGFGQRALVEGWKSLTADPSDYSGHRFLADTYSVLPRHGFARASELLQSQLLQPVNLTPISPILPSSSRPLQQVDQVFPVPIEGAGPANATFNEFNPLFYRDRVGFYTSGIVGNQNLLGDEAVLSGVHGALSYSLGQSHIQSDGFRPNNDSEQDLYHGFFQVTVTPNTSLQTEYRYITAEQGDLRRRFDPTNFRSDLRKDLIAHIGRVGFHHEWSAQSDMLGSFVYGHSDTGISSNFDLNSREESYIGEIQNIYRGNWFSLTGGLGHYSAAGDEFSLVSSIPVDSTRQIEHNNVYLYSDLHYHKRLQLTLGVTADFYTRDETFQIDNTITALRSFNFERNRVNPKVGILWSPTPDTTVRLAAFRVIQRSLPSNQTLEPTQVVGFNQFFDDAQGIAAWRYGVGLDQRFSLDLYGGAELSTRDLELFNPDGGNFRAPSWQELLGRAYLYWAPHPRWALSAEYYYERLNRELNVLESIERVTTHRVPLGFSFIHPSGLSFRFNPTFVHQEGVFIGPEVEEGPGEDSFVVVGARLSYRLPKRYGLLNLGVENLFDADFRFQETDVNGPLLEAERQVFGSFTFSF